MRRAACLLLLVCGCLHRTEHRETQQRPPAPFVIERPEGVREEWIVPVEIPDETEIIG